MANNPKLTIDVGLNIVDLEKQMNAAQASLIQKANETQRSLKNTLNIQGSFSIKETGNVASIISSYRNAQNKLTEIARQKATERAKIIENLNVQISAKSDSKAAQNIIAQQKEQRNGIDEMIRAQIAGANASQDAAVMQTNSLADIRASSLLTAAALIENNDKVGEGYKRLQRDIEEAENQIAFFKQRGVVVGSPEDYRLRDLTEELKKLTEQKNALDEALKRPNEVIPPNAVKNAKELSQQMKNLNMAAGLLISDAGMFSMGWQIGIRSIGNNIPMFLNAINQARVAGESFGSMIKGILGSFTFWAQAVPAIIELMTLLGNSLSSDTNKTKLNSEEKKKLNEQLEREIENRISLGKALVAKPGSLLDTYQLKANAKNLAIYNSLLTDTEKKLKATITTTKEKVIFETDPTTGIMTSKTVDDITTVNKITGQQRKDLEYNRDIYKGIVREIKENISNQQTNNTFLKQAKDINADIVLTKQAQKDLDKASVDHTAEYASNWLDVRDAMEEARKEYELLDKILFASLTPFGDESINMKFALVDKNGNDITSNEYRKSIINSLKQASPTRIEPIENATSKLNQTMAERESIKAQIDDWTQLSIKWSEASDEGKIIASTIDSLKQSLELNAEGYRSNIELVKTAMEGFSNITNLLGESSSIMYSNQLMGEEALLDKMKERHQYEQNALEEAGLKNTVYYKRMAAKQAQEEKRKQEQIKAIQANAWDAEQKSRMTGLLMAGAQAAVNIWTATPFSLTQAILSSALLAATTGISIANINSQRNPYRYAQGGFVPGMTSGDSVSARLEPGEFVVNRKAALKNAELLEAMNSNKSIGSNSINININGEVIGSDEFVREILIPSIRQAVRDGVKL